MQNSFDVQACLFLSVYIPFTANVVEWVTFPALFVATHVYSPACLAATDSMLSALICLLILVIVKSGSLKPIALPLNFHTISTGKSPFIIEQVAETMSPEFAGPSLIENGPICGATTTTTETCFSTILLNPILIRLIPRERERETNSFSFEIYPSLPFDEVGYRKEGGKEGRRLRACTKKEKRSRSRRIWCTVDGESCGITRPTGCVADRARVLSRVSRCHTVDRQQADPLAGVYYRYVVMITRDRLAVQRPLYLDRVIPFHHRARCRHGVPPIRWPLSDIERHDFRCNCSQHNICIFIYMYVY